MFYAGYSCTRYHQADGNTNVTMKKTLVRRRASLALGTIGDGGTRTSFDQRIAKYTVPYVRDAGRVLLRYLKWRTRRTYPYVSVIIQYLPSINVFPPKKYLSYVVVPVCYTAVRLRI